MSDPVTVPGGRQKLPPFPHEYRAAGLLLHVTSLPSPYGIGDLGPEAFAWIDRLHDAGQSWGQALPLGPTGYGNSPYQPLSSFAGNALVMSPQLLISEGLLDASECDAHFAPAGGNWCWRVPDDMLPDEPFAWLRGVTGDSERFDGVAE